MSVEDLKAKLAKYVINRAKYPHVPASLDGEILLEEDRDKEGNLKGVITISAKALANVLAMRDDPAKRPERLKGKTKDEFERVTGHKKYLDKWKAEGIDFGV